MSYIDGESYGTINFASITGEDIVNDMVVENLTITQSLTLPDTFDGINLVADNVSYNISNYEISTLNNARSNLQNQIDNLSPDLSQNIGYWGTFWTNTDLTATTANTAYPITYTNTDPSSNGVVYNNNSRIQVLNKGIYLIIFSAQMYSSNSNTGTVHFWLRKNGTNVADTALKEELKQTTKLIVCNFQLALNANDYVELVWDTNDTSIRIEHFNATASIPAIPSIIVSVSQITYYQDNSQSVDAILQRITGITYNSNTSTTNITGGFLVNGLQVQPAGSYMTTNGTQSVSGAKTFTGGVSITTNNLTVSSGIDLTGNLNVNGNIITTINGLQQNIVSYINSIKSQVDSNSQKLTGISYDGYQHITNLNSNVNITGYLNTSIQGQQQNLVGYVDQQVAIAYDRGTQGVNAAAAAQNSANNAQSTADGAMSLASGASAGVAGLAGVVSQHTTDIAALGAGLAITDANVATLQVKTQNMSAIVGETTFAGQVFNGDTTINPFSILTPTLDAETAVITPSISSNTNIINITPSVQNFQGTTINIGASTGGSAINIATDGTLNTVSIGNLTTPVYINSTLYVPFNPANLTSFLRQFAYTV